SSNKIKSMWKVVNQHRPKPKQIMPTANLNDINNFFVKMAENFSFLKDNGKAPNLEFALREVSFNEVRECFNAIKNSKSKDIYSLNTEIIKLIKISLSYPFQN